MALRLLCSSARRSGSRIRCLASPCANALDCAPHKALEDIQKLPGSDLRTATAWPINWGSLHGKKTSVKKLCEALEAELEHEEQEYDLPEILRKDPPGGYTIKDENEETARITLTKKHGEEEICLDVVYTQQPSPEAENPDDEDSTVSHRVVFNAKFTKGSETLNCEMETDGGYVDIVHAGLEETGKEPEITQYTGPVFSDLDEKLQDNFSAWLEERGIDAELGDYLIQLVHDRELKAYQKWLKAVNAFVAK